MEKLIESKKKILGPKEIKKSFKTKSKLHLDFRILHSFITLLREGSSPPNIARQSQFFRLGSVFGFPFFNQLLPRFLHPFLFGSPEPSLVRFSFFMRSQESSSVFLWYPQFLLIFVDIFLDFLGFFPLVFLETPLVYFQLVHILPRECTV